MPTKHQAPTEKIQKKQEGRRNSQPPCTTVILTTEIILPSKLLHLISSSVLVLAETDLIFFTVASAGLCSGLCWKQCWQYRDVLVIAKQHSHSVQAFAAAQNAPLASRLRTQKLGGDKAGTADPNCPKRYSIPYDDGVLSNETRGKVSGGAAARGLPGHRSVGGEQFFSFASLVCLGFYFCYFPFHYNL